MIAISSAREDGGVSGVSSSCVARGGFSPEARRGSQGASRAAPGKSGLHARGEGERVLTLESREGTRASRRVEEGLSRSLSGGGGFVGLCEHGSEPG